MAETGSQADARRLSVLLRPDGAVIVPPRLAPWVRALLVDDLRSRRREGGAAYDVLALIDALDHASATVAVNGNDVIQINRIGLGDVPCDQVDDPASTREAAEELQCSERTVRWMLAHGRLVGRKSGRAWLVSRASIHEYMHGKAA